ncbi:hypothetical protein HBI25_155320 [Parastagonospora nodorum]|nr:hypothetical protein HBI95_155110 [Parastagonospora nodorum]KAH5000524.1 hypothetical protein HBI77_159860 [Parastagonospora nodorum]KAH5108514.1 hypothetical protein HBH71_183720 [Parastagonospora nodorum]KAH5537259.1 hypothetical protein HBI27_146060 [Parastagonospora nodorum]KAH5555169.1 hypothetical protein HBI25_155320 [Parastagonospora nodorum]
MSAHPQDRSLISSSTPSSIPNQNPQSTPSSCSIILPSIQPSIPTSSPPSRYPSSAAAAQNSNITTTSSLTPSSKLTFLSTLLIPPSTLTTHLASSRSPSVPTNPCAECPASKACRKQCMPNTPSPCTSSLVSNTHKRLLLVPKFP